MQNITIIEYSFSFVSAHVVRLFYLRSENVTALITNVFVNREIFIIKLQLNIMLN